MKFKTFYKSLAAQDKKDLANRLGTSCAYLSQVANGHRMAGAKLLLKIAEATNSEVSPSDLRPDIEEATAHE